MLSSQWSLVIAAETFKFVGGFRVQISGLGAYIVTVPSLVSARDEGSRGGNKSGPWNFGQTPELKKESDSLGVSQCYPPPTRARAGLSWQERSWSVCKFSTTVNKVPKHRAQPCQVLIRLLLEARGAGLIFIYSKYSMVNFLDF